MSPGAPCSAAMRPDRGDGISTTALSVSTETQRLVGDDVVADADVPGDDLGLLQALAEIGQREDVLMRILQHAPRRRRTRAVDRACSGASSRGSGITVS